ncbi:MAG: Holliday junction branch migration protein RuvA [Rhizobium sp.]|nr:Holliday junction branch migration protein RuvA [Rhizobium sp.]
MILFSEVAILIGRISGILAEKNPPQILVDVGGVGYEIDVPMSSFYNLPNIGDKVVLLTEFIVREDAQLLFGFLTHDERITFRQLLKVSGVGARTALAVLSGMSVADLAHAVAMQEVGRLTKVPGIGKKTAERLLLELKGKLPNAPGAAAGGSAPVYVPNVSGDILNALMALGYNEREALAAMKGLAEDVTVSDGIRQALKLLGKG